MSSVATHTVEVLPQVGGGLIDARGASVKHQLATDYNVLISDVRSSLGYLIKGQFSDEELELAKSDLFSDPIIESALVNTSFLESNTFSSTPDISILVGFKPGVTDNRGHAAIDGLKTIFPDRAAAVSTTIAYHFWGVPESIDAPWLAAQLHNPMIERCSIANREDCTTRRWPNLDFPELPSITRQEPATVSFEVSDAELISISERGLLALNLEEMQTIQAHYRKPEVRSERVELGLPEGAPTDVELECLAQTWSEHCKHKIFASLIHHVDHETGEDSIIDSLFATHIRQPTLDIQKEVDWLLSIFHDNSGVIAWSDEWSLCMKAETHNSPSALDPFGGAMTGIVGVNRDILGTGLGARPIANTDVFCFGPPDYSGSIPEGLFHPSRVFRGVHAGVRAGGNESGIPTVNGAMVFDERYIGKPLVYCGTVGIMPRRLPDGRESHIKTPTPGDIIYMVGGRVGSDGIHGATFSSLELTQDSPSSAVQIGDPITQKKMVDMLLEARDEGLLQVTTDNGAGGLSSSVGEMAELTGGAVLDLSAVPLKQAGLSSWEILVSESQERMTVGIKRADCAAFEALASLHEVEASEVGTFTNSGSFVVKHGDSTVAHLPISFLHDGCPQLHLESEWTPPSIEPIIFPPSISPADMGALLSRLLARPNVASKEWWVRSYDHEVIAQSVIKPFCGVNHDAPGDAAVIAPIQGETHGAVISCGIAPRYSDIDAYGMVAAAVDEAVRNAVCVGVDLDMIAGLDNFCWPDPVESAKTPDGRYKLAQLVRANRALDEVCRAYQLPCISGKDSMKNDVVMHGEKISVPPTMLFSLFGNHSDVRKAVSSDFKRVGDTIYLCGETHQELGASEFAFMLRDLGNAGSAKGGIGGALPHIDTSRNLSMYRSLTAAMQERLVASAHDCSDGGFSVALAECCFGANAGAKIDISPMYSDAPKSIGQKPSNNTLPEHDNPTSENLPLDIWGVLFGESLGRILVSVRPDRAEEFEAAMDGHACHRLGSVVAGDEIRISIGDEPALIASMSQLRTSWKATLDGGRE